jgi:ATP-binding cassette subfamily C protein
MSVDEDRSIDGSRKRTSAPDVTPGGIARHVSGRALGTVAGLSGAINLLALSGSIFMMLVYDMVLPSRNDASLVGLLVILAVCYGFQNAMETTRSRTLRQAGSLVASRLAPTCSDASRRLALAGRHDVPDPVNDLDAVRSFVSGPGPVALIDLPWSLLFVAVLWMLHPWLGMVTLGGAAALAMLTFHTERTVSAPAREAEEAASARRIAFDRRRRSAETVRALGMQGSIDARVDAADRRHQDLQERLASLASVLGGASRTSRMMLQSLVLATGAVLVIQGRATGGVIFASSILSARALSPVDVAIANWRGFSAARAAWRRLSKVLSGMPAVVERTPLPAPVASLKVEGLAVAPPGAGSPTLHGVSFGAVAGSAIAVVGPSGGGKTTLLKALVGAWTPAAGSVRLDGAALDQWNPDCLGRHVGWLPQEIDLFEGTISENVSRFDASPDPELVVAAAKAAGAHETIVSLPQGYDTRIGEGGVGLSSGQRQRVGLARALYREPFLVVLDEPAANLDAPGEQALVTAVSAIRRRGGLCVVSAHRPSVVRVCDLALVVGEGRLQSFGPAERVFAPRPSVANPQDGAAA